MKITLSILILFFFCQFTSAQKNQITLVIDAGHGGSDPGHLPVDTSSLVEKELNLLIANYFGSYIDKYLQNIKIIYTRKGDTFPSLDDRVETANSNKADYFISIHCNGYENTAIHGTESHVHSMELTKSVELAKKIEHQFSSRADRHSRGVKDQNDLGHSLQVLKYTNMTSVLVECGYITNEEEKEYLNSTKGQEYIASAIFRAFRSQIQADYPNIDFVKKAASTAVSTNGKYWVQIMSTKTSLDINNSCFKSYKGSVIRKELQSTSAYKFVYLVGSYDSKEEAEKNLPLVRENGFSDAYVVFR